MAETRLRARDPLVEFPISIGADLRLSRSPLTSRFVFQASEKEAGAFASVIGLSATPGMLRAEATDESALLRIAPDEFHWWATPDFARERRRFVPENGIEISHGLVGLVAEAPSLVPVLAAACPLDWHEKAFPCGMATRSLFGKFDVLVWRQAPNRVQIVLGRSYIPGFVAFFRECARSAG